jgi:hypothetical protein
MRRVSDPLGAMDWLSNRPEHERFTGYDAGGWEASTWVLHAMYQNPDLSDLGTHDDLHQRRLQSGDLAPLIIGDVDLDSQTTVSGTPLGFVVRPSQPWQRVRWADYLANFPNFAGDRAYPPCDRWFPPGGWPVAVAAPAEGSLDEESLDALIEVLAAHSGDASVTPCYAFYGSLPAGDFDSVHLWEGPLRSVANLISARGGPYDFSPTNLWPVDRSWFVWTDYDLEGTKVSGSRALVDSVDVAPTIESADWRTATRRE